MPGVARFQLSYACLRNASMTQLAVTRRNFELAQRFFSTLGLGFDDDAEACGFICRGSGLLCPKAIPRPGQALPVGSLNINPNP